jgi:hypothetical protein
MGKQTAFVCKRNYALYVDSIIKSDTTLQQRFHCLEATLGTNKPLDDLASLGNRVQVAVVC